MWQVYKGNEDIVGLYVSKQKALNAIEAIEPIEEIKDIGDKSYKVLTINEVYYLNKI